MLMECDLQLLLLVLLTEMNDYGKWFSPHFDYLNNNSNSDFTSLAGISHVKLSKFLLESLAITN